jgi:hypothetical protein
MAGEAITHVKARTMPTGDAQAFPVHTVTTVRPDAHRQEHEDDTRKSQ